MTRSDKIRAVLLGLACACGRRRHVRLERLSTFELDEEQVAFWLDEARRDGWVVGKAGDLCPNCKPEV